MAIALPPPSLRGTSEASDVAIHTTHPLTKGKIWITTGLQPSQ